MTPVVSPDVERYVRALDDCKRVKRSFSHESATLNKAFKEAEAEAIQAFLEHEIIAVDIGGLWVKLSPRPARKVTPDEMMVQELLENLTVDHLDASKELGEAVVAYISGALSDALNPSRRRTLDLAAEQLRLQVMEKKPRGVVADPPREILVLAEAFRAAHDARVEMRSTISRATEAPKAILAETRSAAAGLFDEDATESIEVVLEDGVAAKLSPKTFLERTQSESMLTSSAETALEAPEAHQALLQALPQEPPPVPPQALPQAPSAQLTPPGSGQGAAAARSGAGGGSAGDGVEEMEICGDVQPLHSMQNMTNDATVNPTPSQRSAKTCAFADIVIQRLHSALDRVVDVRATVTSHAVADVAAFASEITQSLREA
jgi:hypothetical protein